MTCLFNLRFVGPKVAIFQDCGQMVGQSIVIWSQKCLEFSKNYQMVPHDKLGKLTITGSWILTVLLGRSFILSSVVTSVRRIDITFRKGQIFFLLSILTSNSVNLGLLILVRGVSELFDDFFTANG